MEFRETALDGLVAVQLRRLGDDRGSFTKTFHADAFADAGLALDVREQYCSTSAPGVVRGMHFQLPPHDHAKLVIAVSGRALDVVVDLRPGSPTYGEHEQLELAPGGSAAYIPAGMAHGFATLGDEPVTLLYNVTSVHAPEHDTGVRWDSIGMDWPVDDPIVSTRDAALPPLAEFEPPAAWSVPS